MNYVKGHMTVMIFAHRQCNLLTHLKRRRGESTKRNKSKETDESTESKKNWYMSRQNIGCIMIH